MKINFKGIAVYIFLIIVSVLFMLYLDGPGGGYLLIALVTAAIISLSLCIYTRYCISLKTEVNSDVLNCGDIATVTVHIKKIREKIEFNTAKPQYIETIWGVGYRFKV